MDALAVSGIQLFPVKDFDQIVAIRAERHEHLRGRNNVTSCRSPKRDFDTKLIKNELKKKRHLEFLRRRSVSPEPCALRSTNRSSRTHPSPTTFSLKHHTSVSNSSHINYQNNPTANGRPVILTTNSTTDGPSTSTWVNTMSSDIIRLFQKIHFLIFQHPYKEIIPASSFFLSLSQASLWPEQVTMTRQEKGHASTSTQNSVNGTFFSTSNITVKSSWLQIFEIIAI